jgi:hypothetical protein
MRKAIALIVCLAIFVNGCAPKTEPKILIIPNQCKISAGEEFPISLQGSNMPANSEITWSATKGDVNPTNGLNVIYTAPQEPGTVIINAQLEAENVKYSTTLICEVIATTSTTASDTPPVATPSNTPATDLTTIAITEVMAAPCNGLSGPNKNEYIELYNYGNNDIDVNGWWIATGPGGEGTPDQITSWNIINPGISLGNNVVTDSSIIPPNGFAIIISPLYYIGEGKDHMPYIFPKKTIILTLANSNYLGNDNTGLLGSVRPLSTLVLYIGSNSFMDTVVSTYGTPNYGSSPKDVTDDKLDAFPYPVSDCHSIERIVASGGDLLGNWRTIDKGNPGEGDYPP